jgi:hypothetical protein
MKWEVGRSRIAQNVIANVLRSIYWDLNEGRHLRWMR